MPRTLRLIKINFVLLQQTSKKNLELYTQWNGKNGVRYIDDWLAGVKK